MPKSGMFSSMAAQAISEAKENGKTMRFFRVESVNSKKWNTDDDILSSTDSDLAKKYWQKVRKYEY